MSIGLKAYNIGKIIMHTEYYNIFTRKILQFFYL